MLVTVLISRSSKEVRTYLHVQVRSGSGEVESCAGGKGKKGKGEGQNKGDRPRNDGKGKGEQSVKQRYFNGYCNQRNQTVRARTNSSMARVTSVEHMGTRELTVLLKRWHIWNPNL